MQTHAHFDMESKQRPKFLRSKTKMFFDAGDIFLTPAKHPTSHDAVARARKCNILRNISRFVDPVPISFWVRDRQNEISTYKQINFSFGEVQNFENCERHQANFFF